MKLTVKLNKLEKSESGETMIYDEHNNPKVASSLMKKSIRILSLNYNKLKLKTKLYGSKFTCRWATTN